MTISNPDFRTIRQWHGSQYQAFEELCYQLRDPTPEGAELVKTGNPDGGLEWYVTRRDGVLWGWQAKFIFEVDDLLKSMEKSLKTVVEKRPKCEGLTFCIPFDLPDAPGTGKRKSARQKFEDRKTGWCKRIPGAERVRIDLWSGGDLLQRLVGHPNQRGIEKFFWDREVFSYDWCVRRMEKTVDEAGERYTPELHVDLPVAFALEGLARSETYWQRFRSRRSSVLKAATYLKISRFTGIGVTRQLQRLAKSLDEWQDNVPKHIDLPRVLDRTLLLDRTHAVRQAAHEAYPRNDSTSRKQGKATKRQTDTGERRNRLQYGLGKLLAALQDFEDLLEANATKAAGHGALLLTGEAGQGKTHLFCDTVQRAVDTGQPAVLLFGERFSGRHVWTGIGEQLGLGQVGSEALLGAMQAAAEASNAPFLLLIDALNDAEYPRAWQSELPGFLAEIAQNPWISLGVSVRSTYRDIVLPGGELSGIAKVQHPGFAGREIEAAERFFSVFGLEQPGAPLLESEFTNPLFLKLYCEGLKEMGLNAPQVGESHVSDVFEYYLKAKAVRIADRLHLDPVTRPVQTAIDAFCTELVDANEDSLKRSRATDIINAFAPDRTQWPDTMLGALLSESVLIAEVSWDSDTAEFVDVIRFTYQRFADYRVGSALLKPFMGNPQRLREALTGGEPLLQRFLQAPAGWIESLSVQMPEQFGVELLDVAQWQLNTPELYWWDEAFVRSIVARRPSAMTERSRALLREVQHRSPDLCDDVLDTILSVSSSPRHLLNANFLHERLKGLPMPERDDVWSIPTYFAFEEGKTLDRLIRWAARGPPPKCKSEVVELAAIPIVWTFTSPNRHMRDYATKALTKLLSGHLPVLSSLIRRFDGVDDPYVIERLAVVSHGAVLCGGSDSPHGAVKVAEQLKEVALAETQVPNIITRDAVRGVHEWCVRHELIDQQVHKEVLPPYGSAPAEVPRTEAQLRHEYSKRITPSGNANPSYGSLFSSLFGLADFRHYVIEPKLREFSRWPLSSKCPELSLEDLYSVDIGARWVFERVISLGWTSENFGDFDSHRLPFDSGGHKAERFGKKYQWIALRELIARVADNFHMMSDFDRRRVTYAGPWQFFGRDIDPTLPPPRRLRDGEDEFRPGSTFFEDDTWWKPLGPRYHRDDPPVEKDWAVEGEVDILTFELLTRRKDESGTHWVALHAHYQWGDDVSEEEPFRPRRQLWSEVFAWLVQSDDRDALVSYLEHHSLMGRWMPEGREHTDAAYLGELPWAEAANEYPATWEEVRARGAKPSSIKVYPAWESYLWEGNVLDCSIDQGVRVWFPSPILFEEGKLTWVPGGREWCTPDGVTVARCFEDNSHMALLVREDWLKRTLRKTGHSMVFGWLGEKRLIAPPPDYGLVGDWTEINGIASLAGNRWEFGERRLGRGSRRT